MIIRNSDFRSNYINVKSKAGIPFKNQRNGIAGILGTDDVDFYAKQGASITFVDYDKYYWETSCFFFADAWDHIVESILKNTDYPLDGIVVKLKDKIYSNYLGYTTHHPRGQVAFKFTNSKATSKLIGVEWGMGKQQISAIGLIEPVEISGITITFYRATDGHKIVLADQESNVSDIYTATGVAWYYILDTANTRFKLPRTKYNVVGLRDTVGNYVAESLPNITGYVGQTSSSSGINYSENGALFWTSKNYNYPANTTNNTNYNYGNRLALDASRSSSTYQDDAPVQQRATQMYLYFYVGNTVQDQTTIDVGEITEALNGKVDLDLSNVTNTGTSSAAGWAMPSDTYTGVTIGASGATYTASHDGWLFLKYNVNSTAIGYVSVTQNGHTDQQVYIGAAYTDCYIFTPIKAGNYSITYANLTFLQANLFHLSGQE